MSGEKKQISLQGGLYATWSRDGGELFYLGPDSKLYAAQMKGLGLSSSVPTPRPLFVTCAGTAPTGSATQGSSFDVFPDGSRFLFAGSDSTSDRYLITVNWQGQP